jgi:hypothetical protein
VEFSQFAAYESLVMAMETKPVPFTRRSVVDQLRTVAGRIKERVEELGKFGDITNLNARERERAMWEDRGGVVIIHANPYEWDELTDEGKEIQHALHTTYGKFKELVKSQIHGRVRETTQRFRELDRSVEVFVEHAQSDHASVAAEIKSVCTAIDQMVELVAQGVDNSARLPVFVPDTNALLYNTTLEDWAFDGVPKFKIVITPTVLHELDGLKINHRNEAVRDKAEKLIRQIKGYRTRGDLHTGVTLRTSVSQLVALAVEPDMEHTLSWLDKDHEDDRLIASTLEVMRQYLHSPVTLVSRDINAQNKATFAGIDVCEPPEPPAKP